MTSSSSTAGAMASVFSAFGAVLGYVGAEAATPSIFEHLLWPQRFYSNFTLAVVPQLALLGAMGGPLHKAALETLDVAFEHGLLRGAHQGSMLGTSFFRKQWAYSIHGKDGDESETGPSRNCIWALALPILRISLFDEGLEPNSEDNLEKGTVAQRKPCRAKVTVSHSKICLATPEDKASKLPFVSESTKCPNIRVILAIFTSELTGILTAVTVAIALRTSWAVFWIVPLVLRLLSAVLALDREPLIQPDQSVVQESPQAFKIHCPPSEGNFILLSGPPSLVVQFFQHYGHPVRNRFRELAQLTLVVLFGCVFPLGLLCSMIWMPVTVQYVWLGYELYIVLAMHIARYTYSGNGAATQARIAEEFGKDSGSDGSSEKTILFGHSRNGPETLRVSAVITSKNRYREGRECMENLLRRFNTVHKG